MSSLRRPFSLALLGLVLAFAHPGQARLGDTLPECRARYGEPTRPHSAQRAEFAWGRFALAATYRENRCISLNFTTRDGSPCTAGEIQQILEQNQAGSSWSPWVLDPESGPDRATTQYERSDSRASAISRGGTLCLWLHGAEEDSLTPPQRTTEAATATPGPAARLPEQTRPAAPVTARPTPSIPVPGVPAPGDARLVPMEGLALTAPRVADSWIEVGGLWTRRGGSLGTAIVLRLVDGRVLLVTNGHCLDLATVAGGLRFGPPKVREYRLVVIFPNKQMRPVRQFALPKSGVDVALLLVDAEGLKEGVDYRALAPEAAELKVGGEVVAVGEPLGLEHTHTFGHISAIRKPEDGSEFKTLLVQHTAAINPGNSGGPLFLKRGENAYGWIGINTVKMRQMDGLNFAIEAQGALRQEFDWFPANPQGAAAALRQHFDQPGAIVAP